MRDLKLKRNCKLSMTREKTWKSKTIFVLQLHDHPDEDTRLECGNAGS